MRSSPKPNVHSVCGFANAPLAINASPCTFRTLHLHVTGHISSPAGLVAVYLVYILIVLKCVMSHNALCLPQRPFFLAPCRRWLCLAACCQTQAVLFVQNRALCAWTLTKSQWVVCDCSPQVHVCCRGIPVCFHFPANVQLWARLHGPLHQLCHARTDNPTLCNVSHCTAGEVSGRHVRMGCLQARCILRVLHIAVCTHGGVNCTGMPFSRYSEQKSQHQPPTPRPALTTWTRAPLHGLQIHAWPDDPRVLPAEHDQVHH